MRDDLLSALRQGRRGCQAPFLLLDRIVRTYTRIAAEIVAVLLGILTLNVVGQVFSRYVLNSPFTWADENARFLLIWITFLGAVVPLERGKHFLMEVLVNALPSPLRRATLVLGNLVVLWILLILIRDGAALTHMNMGQASPAMDIPFGLVYASIPIGALLMLGVVARDLGLILCNPEYANGYLRQEGEA